MGVSHELRMQRLYLLRHVMAEHVAARGKPVVLNGGAKSLCMDSWFCETSACAFGSYALTTYGDRYFKKEEGYWGFAGDVYLRRGSAEDTFDDAARHFGIGIAESRYLFDPDRYPVSKQSEQFGVKPSYVLKRIDSFIHKYERKHGVVDGAAQWAHDTFEGGRKVAHK